MSVFVTWGLRARRYICVHQGRTIEPQANNERGHMLLYELFYREMAQLIPHTVARWRTEAAQHGMVVESMFKGSLIVVPLKGVA